MVLIKIKAKLLIGLFCSFSSIVFAQEQISLEESYQLAKENYPSIKKIDLISKTSNLEVENVSKLFLPQISFSGQASYQSKTVDLSQISQLLPGINIPEISKDQYKIMGEVNQLIYDGGQIKLQKEVIKTNNNFQAQNIETNFYAIKQRINTIYFSILLLESQLRQNDLKKSSLLEQLNKTEAALKYGTAYRSSVNELKAEVISVEMYGIELQKNRTAFLEMLSLFTGKQYAEKCRFIKTRSFNYF